jgi:hypothetical protein
MKFKWEYFLTLYIIKGKKYKFVCAKLAIDQVTFVKEISTNTVSRSRGGYEPTTVPITLGRRAFPLHTYSK